MSWCLGFRRRSSVTSFDCIRVVHLNGIVEDLEDPVTVGELTSNSSGGPPGYFVCTPAQLLSFRFSKTLPPETLLRRRQIYFLLPFSVLASTPVDLVNLSNRLTAVAKRFRSNEQMNPGSDSLQSMRSLSNSSSVRHTLFSRSRRTNSTRMRANPFSPSMGRSKSTSTVRANPVLPSMPRSSSSTTVTVDTFSAYVVGTRSSATGRVNPRCSPTTTLGVNSLSERTISPGTHGFPVEVDGVTKMSLRSQSWKPNLESINERSFAHWTESDLLKY